MLDSFLLLIPLGFLAFLFLIASNLIGLSGVGIACSIFVVLVAALTLPLSIGVWLPDMFSSRARTLASTKLADGTDFRVVQYWGSDFYTTELWHTTSDGQQHVEVLDGDDCKSWHVPLSVDSQNRTVSVTLCGDREKTIRWELSSSQ